MSRLFVILTLGWVMWVGTAVDATMLNVRVENLQPEDGFYFTPVWIGVHDGTFDVFDTGESASSELEALAEGGDTQPLTMAFAVTANLDARTANVVAPEGFPDLPVFDPGDDVTLTIDIGDATLNRFLNYASMVIPSNDAFFGNDEPIELFSADGTFVGPVTIDVLGFNLYDARTELNDGMGAPFSAIFGISTDESGTIGILPGLNNFFGTDTAAGTTLGSGVTVDEPVARIHITAVPEPTSAALLIGLAIWGLGWHRRPSVTS